MSSERKPRNPLLRRHSLAGTRASPSQRQEESGRSLFRFIMNLPWRQRSVSTPAIDSESRSSASHHHDNTNEGAESSVRVVATVLQPQLYYKSVPVTMTTTVNNIIVKLVSRYAVVAEDKDPNSFYLMETHDRKQGSYSRVLPNSEEVGSILQRWGPDSGYFTLTRRPTTVRSEPLFYSSPSLFSPERSNLFSYQAFVEEGCGSQLSQSLSDVSAELSSSPQKQGRRHGNIASLVSPYSHGASRKGTDPEKNTSSLSRLQDTGVFSSFSASYSRESTPMSPTSPLIVDSPTHQYIVTGSTSGCHHSDESFHGNDSGGPSHFLFPSANPGSPTATEGSHGNNTPVNKPNSTDENKEAESVLLGFGETAREGRGEEGEEGETSESQRRKELSEKMKMSVERGLGEIMAQIVEEGRPQVAGGGEGEVEKEEEGEEGETVEEKEEQKEKENEIRELDQNGKEMMTENEGAKEGEREEGERKEEEGEREQMAGETVEVLQGEEEHEDLVVKIEETGEVEMKETGEVEMKEKHQQQEELKEIQSDVITVTTLDSSPRPVATATAAGHAYQRESCVIVNPVHKTSASLLFHQEPGEEGGAWMNLSDQFQSAMNIIDSFSTAMDENLGTEPPQTGTKTDTGTNSQNETKSSLRATPTATPTTPDKKKQEKPQDLVSPDRRKKLVEQAAKRIPFKRAHTFDVGVSHTPSPPVGHAHPTSRTPSSSPAQSRAKREGRDLVSKARKDRMMNDALAKMRQRFASNN